MVDRAVLPQLLCVVHGLRAVPVGVEQEAAVVVVSVLRSRARLTVASVAGADTDSPELVDVPAGRGREADVEPLRRGLAFPLGHQGIVVPLHELVAVVRRLDPERAKHRVVEALGDLAIGDADGDVVEHATMMPKPRFASWASR